MGVVKEDLQVVSVTEEGTEAHWYWISLCELPKDVGCNHSQVWFYKSNPFITWAHIYMSFGVIR